MRVLRSASLAAPIAVPGPDAWGPVAVAAHDEGFEAGFARGLAQGRAEGRQDLSHAGDELRAALAECCAAIAACRDELLGRVMEVAELLVTTVLRHQPDTATAGLLVRVREALDGIDAGQVELRVHGDVQASVAAEVDAGVFGVPVQVATDDTLAPGEFRLRAEWADAHATWQHYLDAAREAVAMHLAALDQAGAV